MVLVHSLVTMQRAGPAAAESAANLYRLDFRAMGTQCKVQFDAGTPDQAEAFRREALDWVVRFEAKFSRFQPDSLISRINDAAGREWVELDPEAERLFDLCDGIHFLTKGVLDPTALPVMRLWDFRSPSLKIPGDDAIAAALAKVGWTKVRREPGRIFLPEEMALDFGGFGKEYAVDQVAEIAVRHGLSCALVDFGQDLRAIGRPPGGLFWHIGLEDPRKAGSCWAGAGLVDAGIASSGDYLRYFEKDGVRYGHIIDPRTGRPTRGGQLSATVVANSCLEAGILSTAAFILGPGPGLKLIDDSFGAEGCIFTGHKLHQTRGFYGVLVSKN